MSGLGKLGFNGKSVLITGGCSGIGAASARLAAVRGAKVMIASPNADKLAAVAEGSPPQGGSASGWYATSATKRK
jgi:hypothetical protein